MTDDDLVDLIKRSVKYYLINDDITIINELKIFRNNNDKYGLQEKDLIKINLADHYMNNVDDEKLIKIDLNITTLNNYILMCKKKS